MKIKRSVRTRQYKKRFAKLPRYVQEDALAQFLDWREEGYPIIGRLKKINRTSAYYAIEITDWWRGVAYIDGDVVVWHWIGSHEDYNNFISQLKA